MVGVVARNSIIELRLPPSLRFANVVRVIAASVAADENFSIAALADLRTAVHEAFDLLVEHTVPADRSEVDDAILVRFSISPGRLEVELVIASNGAFTGTSPPTRSLDRAGYVLVIAHGRVILTKSP